MRFFLSFSLLFVCFLSVAISGAEAGFFGKKPAKEDAQIAPPAGETDKNAAQPSLSGVFDETPGVHAEEQADPSVAKAGSEVVQAQSQSEEVVGDVDDVEQGVDGAKLTKSERVKYLPVTRSTLSQLYWAMDNYETTNDTDVDNFLLLNRCDLYQDLYRDDFKWHKIRSKAKISLDKNKSSFPTRMKIVQPIWLQRYSFQDSSFPLFSPFATRRFEIQAIDHDEWECKKYAPSRFVWKYPSTAELTFSTPIEIQKVDVTPEIAKLYNEKYSDMKLHQKRPAFVVIYFKVFEADPVPTQRGFTSKVAQISAVAERIEFYADIDLTLHLSTLDFRRRNTSRFTGDKLKN